MLGMVPGAFQPYFILDLGRGLSEEGRRESIQKGDLGVGHSCPYLRVGQEEGKGTNGCSWISFPAYVLQ